MPDFFFTGLKVLYVGLTLAVELGIAVQIENIGEGFFTRPQVARLTTPTGTSAHDDE